METFSLLMVDDHVLFREGLKALFTMRAELTVVGEADDGAEAVEKARELMPDLILMDVRMPGMSGLEATRRIMRELPAIKIVMLTVSEDDQDLFAALKAGAQGYLLKNTPSSELLRLLKNVFAGESPISGLMATKILNEFTGDRSVKNDLPEETLTEREREVLQLIGRGATNREIADQLYISESTAKKHMRNIMAKLHLQNRVQAALFAAKQGLTETNGGQKDT